MRGWPAVLSVVVIGASACGDRVLCPSAPFVVIQPPPQQLTAGNVVDVRVRTTFAENDVVTLDVRDAANKGLGRFEAMVDATGTAMFTGVMVRPPTTTLDAFASSECGEASDRIALDVATGQNPDELTISFALPAADGLVARADGQITGGALAFSLCGTVSALGANVDVSIDGGPSSPATVDGSLWCLPVSLGESPPAHAIAVSASSGGKLGNAELALTVDLTPPNAIADLAASVVDRHALRLAWTAPDDDGAPVARYLVRLATTPLTDANFDTTGFAVANPSPQQPGSSQHQDLLPVTTGASYWVGVAAVDGAGNRTAAQIVGPLTPAFTQLATVLPPNPALGNVGLGSALAHGKFNDDDFEDLAVGAPTQNVGALAQAGAVYIYFGSATGFATTPSLVITGTAANGRFGISLAPVRWSSVTRDDLAVGAPGDDGGNGTIYVFHGGALAAGARTATSADQRIGVLASAPGWFANSALGHRLVAADLDGDGIRDLVAAATAGGAGIGGIAILYGSSFSGDVALSDVDASGSGGAVVELLQDPAASPGHQFGFYLHAVGPTQGPTDPDEDLVVAPADDTATAGDSLYILRGGMRPTLAGVSPRTFTIGRDTRVDDVTVYKLTEWSSQATSIADQNGNGTRELVVSGYIDQGSGRVMLIDGGTLGTNGVARTSDPGVVLTSIIAPGGVRFGAALPANDGRAADVDGDGREDLLVGGVVGSAKLFVWFGGGIPIGATTTNTASYVVIAPSTFLFTRSAPGFAGQALWLPDINGDGLDDVCWASPNDNARDGSFQVMK